MGGSDRGSGDERAARLAAALRANLKRRKAQAREGSSTGDDRQAGEGDDAAWLAAKCAPIG